MILLLSLIFLSSSENIFLQKARFVFHKYVNDYNKTYSNKEIEGRLQTFTDNIKVIHNLNQQNNSVYGITKYADWTNEEIQNLRNRNGKPRHKLLRRTSPIRHHVQLWQGECAACKRFPNMAQYSKNPPQNWDWVAMGAVFPPIDQGMCGNCYAYAATGDIEGAWYLARRPLKRLSVQQITSCDRFGDDFGCQGSSTNLDTFAYVIQNGGLASDETYPLSAKTIRTGNPLVCKLLLAKKIHSKIKGSLQISGNTVRRDEEVVRRAIYNLGPMTIGINAKNLQFYQGGVIRPRHCAGGWDDLDHQVMLVGYGVDNGTPYWKIRNSWGTNWGEKGFFRLYRGTNLCGVVTDVVHSVVDLEL